jgi:glycosyltransferase involved in cell wall biosynthesis
MSAPILPSMRTSDEVSVVIPTYNRAPLLRQAIASVLSQTAPVREILVIDDGSTDGTASVVREFERPVPAIVYIQLEHTNRLGSVRHTGIERATGSIIALLDSDDLWLPERVEAQLSSWNKRLGDGLGFCNIRRFDAGGPFPGGPWLDPRNDYNGRIVQHLLLEPVALPSALMFDRVLYEDVGSYSSRPVNEDYEWLLEAAACSTAGYVREPLVMMRAHEGSRSREKSVQAHAEYLEIVRHFVAAHPELTHAEKRAARTGMANVHLKLARQMLEIGRPVRAAREAARSIRLNPMDRRGYVMLAAALISQRERIRRATSPR